MELEKLVKKATSGIMTLALVGGLTVGLEGRTVQQEMSDAEKILALSDLILLTENPKLVKAGSFFRAFGSRMFQKELEKIRSNLNININQQGQPQYTQYIKGNRLPENVLYAGGKLVPAPGYSWVDAKNPRNLRVQRSIQVFAANYWKDFNKNGDADFPDEFGGIKNRFYDTEKIMLAFLMKDGDMGLKEK